MNQDINKYYFSDGSIVEYNHDTYIDTHYDKHGNVLYHGSGQDVDIYGKLHRIDGPAIEYSSGDREWYINGIQLSEARWKVHPNRCIQLRCNILRVILRRIFQLGGN